MSTNIPNYPNDGFIDSTIGFTANIEPGEFNTVHWSGYYPDGSTISLSVNCYNRDVGIAFLNLVMRDLRWVRYNQLKAGEPLKKAIEKHFARMPIWFREVDRRNFS